MACDAYETIKRFWEIEDAGDYETAWAQWEATTDRWTRTGVGVCRVRNGRLTYYRDYMSA